MRISLFLFYFLFSILHVLAADISTAKFSEDILPILERYCYKCHGDGEEKGGLALDQYKTEKDVQQG